MNTTTSTTEVKFEINLQLTELEARALDAILGYEPKAFLKMFYEHMGSHYLKPYEKGLISLCDNRMQLRYQFHNIGLVRGAVAGLKTNPGLEMDELADREIKPEPKISE